MALPLLREELSLLPGPRRSDGQPTWTLHDPVRNLFFSLDWISWEILRHWSLDDPAEIIRSIGIKTPLHLDEADVGQMVRFLAQNQLLKPQGKESARELAEQLARRRGNPIKWLLHHYLFFRIPLVRPDAWLGRWLGVAQIFSSRFFLLLTLAAFLFGFFQVLRQQELFLATLVDHFTLAGLATYGAALFSVKLLHELGHAFTAKQYGCRIPAMGVAFLVLWPVAYTDTNESWRLTDRWQRLHIASAGIAVELIIAGWATFAWALLPDGGLRSVVFILATTSWLATLAVNASPFMRFDGYFILSDWLDIPNLHERSFALARWRLRESLFNLGEEKPEHFSLAGERVMILFAIAVWIYRLLLFLGIALLVYHFFIKAIGILLFGVEVVWFILRPIMQEIREWRQRSSIIRQRRRSYVSGFLLLGSILLLMLPWPGRITTSGLLRPTNIYPVHAPGPSQVMRFDLAERAEIAAGQALISLSAPDLEASQAGIEARIGRLRQMAETAGFDSQSRARMQSLRDEVATAKAELASIQEDLARYAPVAPFAGHLHDINPDLSPGVWLGNKERIALLVGPGAWMVEAYLDEADVRRIALGGQAVFVTDSAAGEAVPLTVTNIDADASRSLKTAMLAASVGGSVLTRDRKGQKIPEHSVYRVVLRADTPDAALSMRSWRGTVTFEAEWQSPILRYVRNALAILIREASF
nr:site-2 protease family protein [uncultured Cohaesibacter sp.]